MLKAGSLVMLLLPVSFTNKSVCRLLEENIPHKDTGYKEHSIQQKQT